MVKLTIFIIKSNYFLMSKVVHPLYFTPFNLPRVGLAIYLSLPLCPIRSLHILLLLFFSTLFSSPKQKSKNFKILLRNLNFKSQLLTIVNDQVSHLITQGYYIKAILKQKYQSTNHTWKYNTKPLYVTTTFYHNLSTLYYLITNHFLKLLCLILVVRKI